MRTKGGAVFDGRATLVATMFHRFQVTALALREARAGRQPLYGQRSVFVTAVNLLNRSVFSVRSYINESKT